jgi:hypothetical protein
MVAELFDQTGNAGESPAERGLAFRQAQPHPSVLMHEEIEEIRG